MFITSDKLIAMILLLFSPVLNNYSISLNFHQFWLIFIHTPMGVCN